MRRMDLGRRRVSFSHSVNLETGWWKFPRETVMLERILRVIRFLKGFDEVVFEHPRLMVRMVGVACYLLNRLYAGYF